MKTALISGAAGFLGSHLCDKFLAEDFQVIGVDNFITGNHKNISHLSQNPNFKLIETLRSQLYKKLKAQNSIKKNKSVELLGIELNKFKLFIS